MVCRSFSFVTDIGSRALLFIGYSGCVLYPWLWRGNHLHRGCRRWESRGFPAVAERCYRCSKTKERNPRLKEENLFSQCEDNTISEREIFTSFLKRPFSRDLD